MTKEEQAEDLKNRTIQAIDEPTEDTTKIYYERIDKKGNKFNKKKGIRRLLS